MRPVSMRMFLLLGLALVPPLVSQSALAQTYPDKPIRLIVGYPPGGGTDVVARIITPNHGASRQDDDGV